jgi:tetratricopeptide (TPR) repeat protein
MRKECRDYTPSHFYPDKPFGSMVGIFRNEDLEAQTFEDGIFDIVVTLDVMDHVFRPDRVYAEVFRTLKPGGLYLHCFPIYKGQAAAAVPYAKRDADGNVRHLVDKPEYHGNPVDSKGSLVTFHYGYDIHQKIAEWAPFRVRITRFWDEHQGLIGEFTDVVVCQKPDADAMQRLASVQSRPAEEPAARPSSRQAAVVLGAHRTGTSVLAKALSLMGWQLPKSLVPPGPGNEDGHFESEPIMRFNESVLQGLDRSWLDPKPLPGAADAAPPDALVAEAAAILESEYGAGQRLLIKEPRMSRLLPLWRAAFRRLEIEPLFLLSYRPADAASKSLCRRNGFSLEHGLELWLSYVLDAERGSRGARRCVVPYEALADDPGAALTRALGELGQPLTIAEADLKALRTAVRAARKGEPLMSSSQRLTAAIAAVEAALGGGSLATPGPFDAVRESCNRFWAIASPGAAASFYGLAEAETHFGKSRRLLRQGDAAGALGEAQVAVAMAPNSPHYLCGLGQALEGLNRLEEAEEALQRALRQDPAHKAARQSLAQVQRARGRSN